MKMKALLLSSYSRCIWRTAVLGLAITLPMAAADSPNWRLTPVDVLAVMHRVADWQLAHPSAHNIVNPAKLPSRPRDSVCEQCHLSGEARIPHPGRRVADFRPGQALEEVFSVYVFDTSEDIAAGGAFA